MSNDRLKSQINKIAEEIKGDDENFSIPLFQSGDDLIIPETDAQNWGAKGGIGKSYGGAEAEEDAVPEDEDDDDDDEQSDKKDVGEDDDDVHKIELPPMENEVKGDSDKKDRKAKIGSKVKIKSTGGEGIVTGKNPDGTFKVEKI